MGIITRLFSGFQHCLENHKINQIMTTLVRRLDAKCHNKVPEYHNIGPIPVDKFFVDGKKKKKKNPWHSKNYGHTRRYARNLKYTSILFPSIRQCKLIFISNIFAVEIKSVDILRALFT